MEALSVKGYRNNLAASFTRADNGEQVLIRRKNEIYALVKVGREDLMITPELQARINEVEKACKEGKCATCNTTDFINSNLTSLHLAHRMCFVPSNHPAELSWRCRRVSPCSGAT